MIVSSVRITFLVFPLVCTLLIGCQQASSPVPAKPATSAKPDTQPETAPIGETSATGKQEVTVEVKSWAEVQQLVADQRGKIVVVDVWSTWCVPCMREFPNLVQLHRQFPDKVACISVDIDYIGLKEEPPTSFADKVLEFVSKHEATFPNVISSDPDEDVLNAVGVASIPAVLVYDREGNLRKKFTNDDGEYGEESFTYAQHIIPLVKELLEG